MNPRYKVDSWDLQQLVEVAGNKPDHLHRDLMNRPYSQQLKAWRDNLQAVLNQITAKAWAAGATWAMERTTPPMQVVVTPEQYETLKEEADGQAG